MIVCQPKLSLPVEIKRMMKISISISSAVKVGGDSEGQARVGAHTFHLQVASLPKDNLKDNSNLVYPALLCLEQFFVFCFQGTAHCP